MPKLFQKHRMPSDNFFGELLQNYSVRLAFHRTYKTATTYVQPRGKAAAKLLGSCSMSWGRGWRGKKGRECRRGRVEKERLRGCVSKWDRLWCGEEESEQGCNVFEAPRPNYLKTTSCETSWLTCPRYWWENNHDECLIGNLQIWIIPKRTIKSKDKQE